MKMIEANLFIASLEMANIGIEAYEKFLRSKPN